MNFNTENFDKKKRDEKGSKKIKLKTEPKQPNSRPARKYRRETFIEEESDSSFSIVLESDSLP